MPETTSLQDKAREAIAANPTWYHTIDLAPGISTPGFIDWRQDVGKILPASLHGKRCLDVGTFDGFWAFEMERRGGEVTAIDVDEFDDVDWPPVNRARLLADNEAFNVELGRGFRLVREVRGAKAQRKTCNVYDVSVQRLGGQFDFVFLGALLVHLRNPMNALEALHSVVKPGGHFLAVESVSLGASIRFPRTPVARFEPLTSNFNWWRPNHACLRHYLKATGFVGVDRFGRWHRPPGKPEMRSWLCAVNARRAPG